MYLWMGWTAVVVTNWDQNVNTCELTVIELTNRSRCYNHSTFFFATATANNIKLIEEKKILKKQQKHIWAVSIPILSNKHIHIFELIEK